jgi:predicted Zn-dependent peptidase
MELASEMNDPQPIDRRTPPPIKDAVHFNPELKPCRRFSLDNGIEVYALEAGTEQVLQLDLVFRSGNWYETRNGIAAATNQLLKNGTTRRNAYGISEFFEYHGAYLSRACQNETGNVVLHCLTRHTATLLPVVRELVTDAVFPEQELDIYRQNMKQRLEVNLKKCDIVANRLIDAYLFGHDHPYGRYSTVETYESLTRKQLLAHYDAHYRHGNCMIFVAGVLPADIDRLLNEAFGDLPMNRVALSDVAHPVYPSGEKRHRVSNDPDGVQGAIRIARPFPNRHHPDHRPVQVLNTLFGGYFGSRLMDNIREDKGYTYGIHSYLMDHIGDGAWMISTEAGRDVCEDTVREVYHEMRRLREEPIPEDELMMVKNYLMGTLLGDLDGPFQIIGRWKRLVLNGLDESHFRQTIEVIRDISGDRLTELARKYLVEEDFYELVVV